MKTTCLTMQCVITFLFSLLVFSCQSDTEYLGLTGDLMGFVYLYDKNGYSISDKSGVEIVIEGSNPEKQAFTDKNGMFSIQDLKTGTYNIAFNKDGFSHPKIISYMFVGGNKLSSAYSTTLYELPEVQIESLKMTDTGDKYAAFLEVTANTDFPKDLRGCAFRFYLSNLPDVSYINYKATDYIYGKHGEDLNFYFKVDTNEFACGSDLYMILYPAGDTYQSYIDLETGNYIYSSVNTEKGSNVAKIKVPDFEQPWWY